MTAKPYERGRFEALPESPRIPHGWAATREEYVTVDSEPFGKIRVHVRRAGDPASPPMLLVHGLMWTSYSWRYVFEPLGRRFSVIAPDLPGCGRTQCVPDRPHSA